MPIHPTASEGFTKGADAYEEALPSYPPAAIDWAFKACHISSDARVLDLAAGTGKLTRDLISRVASVTAVEPLDAMRQHLLRVVPEATIMDGTAESIPARDAAFDAVFVAQAFHWFDPEPAIAEMHRVLRPNGSMILMWNTRDKSDPIMRQLWSLIDIYGDEVPKYSKPKTDGLPATPLFREISRRVFPNPHSMTADQMLTRVSSTSYIAVLPASKRKGLLKEVAELLGPALDGDSSFVATYLTEVFCYFANRGL